jgi:hypothetical protein
VHEAEGGHADEEGGIREGGDGPHLQGHLGGGA